MDYQRMIANTNRDNSFMRHNGILLTQMEKDRAVVEADLTETNRNLYGAVHGGMFLTGLCFWWRCSEQRNAICYGQQQL